MIALLVPASVPVVVALGLAAARRRVPRSRQRAIDESLGFTVDLVTVVLGAGGTIRRAIAVVAECGPPPVRPAFAEVVRRSRQGHRLADALAEASVELGPEFHPLVGALLNAEVDGAPITSVLGRLADDLEQRDRWRADAAAGRLPSRLLPPLVLCLLPAVVIGAVVPLAIVALRDLRW